MVSNKMINNYELLKKKYWQINMYYYQTQIDSKWEIFGTKIT